MRHMATMGFSFAVLPDVWLVGGPGEVLATVWGELLARSAGTLAESGGRISVAGVDRYKGRPAPGVRIGACMVHPLCVGATCHNSRCPRNPLVFTWRHWW